MIDSTAYADDHDLDERRLELTADQVAAVRWPVVSWTLFIAALAARDVPWPLTGSWMLLVLLSREMRVRKLVRLRDERQRPIALRLRSATLSILLVGVPQGASALFMLWLDRSLDALLTMVLVSLTAGAVSTSSLIPRAFQLYGSCVLVPTACVWLAGLDAYGIGVALLTLMFLGVQNRFALNNLRTFEESFRIRRENDKLVLQLADARDRAEAATRAKVRFLAAASHDLRQPLHALSMQSAALLLSPMADGELDGVRSMSQSINKLSLLLDALLDVSKLDAGVLRSEPRTVHLSRLLQSLAGTARPLAAAKGLRFDLSVPDGVLVHTDPLLLERLLRNVIDNAIKYTDRGAVELALSDTGAGPRIEVRDSGCGIPAPDQARVFDEFVRIDDGDRSDRRHGLGLGLSIVKRLAELLALGLSLTSEPGRGTTVSVSFRTRAAGGAAPGEPPATMRATLQGVHVLVVDDDEPALHATALLLRQLGCRVTTADSIAAALAASASTPDLLLTDYRLRRGENGLELARQLGERFPDMPAALLTGDTAADRLREANESGLPMLHKPASAEALRELINGLLRPEGPAPAPDCLKGT